MPGTSEYRDVEPPSPGREAEPGPAPKNTSGFYDKSTPPKDTSKPPSSTTGTTVSTQNTETMPEEIAQALSPYEDVLNALPSEYQSAMAGINKGISMESSTGNSELDAAIKGVNQATLSGESGVDTALNGLGAAGSTLEKDLPYSDVLSTLLTEKKNQLQYGTVPTYTVDTSSWSDPLKDIYKYIQGGLAGSTTNGVSSTGADSLPSIQAAAAGTTGSGSVPGSGGPGLGQG